VGNASQPRLRRPGRLRKTVAVNESPGLNRRARLQGRTTPRATKTVERPREEWTHIPVPHIIDDHTFERVALRLADNKRFATRNSTNPNLLQGLAACSGCGYGYYRTSTRTTNKKIHYYRCLGSDDWRYEGGRVCHNKPVRADYLDQVVWDHITALLADPQLIRTEIDKRLDQARTADPARRQRKTLELALAKATTAITRMIEAFSEQLVSIDELRTRMPDLRARETNLRNQIAAIDAQQADRDLYLSLATDVEAFLAQLNDRADTTDIEERRRVLHLVVKDVLIGPDNVTIRHRIPAHQRHGSSDSNEPGNTDTEGDHRTGYQLRWGRNFAVAAQRLPVRLDRQWSTRQHGVLVRYADDVLVMCKSREQAEAALQRLRTLLAELGLQPKEAKTRIVHLQVGGDGVDFLGFHHRLVSSRPRGGRRPFTFLARWPANKAMQHARDRIRELTARRRLLLPVEVIVQDVNAFLRGWTGYFRYGHSAERFSKIRQYVRMRIALWLSKRYRRSRHFGRWALLHFTPNEFGLIRLYGIVVQPRAGKPWRDKPNAGGERRR
jgi:hypothetical protein